MKISNYLKQKFPSSWGIMSITLLLVMVMAGGIAYSAVWGKLFRENVLFKGKINQTENTSDTTQFDLNKTRTDASQTEDMGQIDLTVTMTSASRSATGDVLQIKKTATANKAAYTLTSSGSVLKIENVGTETAGTLTDSTSILGLTNSGAATWTGAHIVTLKVGEDLYIDALGNEILPLTDDDISLGDGTHEFKDLYIDGTAYIDSIEFESCIDFEGSSADEFETTLCVINPTADRSYTLTDGSGTIMVSSLATNAQDYTNSVWGGTNQLIFEGATADGFETILTATDPTVGDKTVTFQDVTGTVYVSSGTDVVVADGGTGTGSLTDHGILLGSGTTAITPLGVAANGQLPIGSTGADPVLGTLTGTSNEITITNAAGSITIDIPDAVTLNTLSLANALTVANGGTGATALTDHGVLLGSDTGAITPLGVAGSGQLVIGSAGADPVLASLTGTTNEITVTNGAGSITIDIPDAVTLNTLSLANALTVTNGGTGTNTLTSGGILLGAGTGAITATNVLTNGQLLIGDGTTAPTVATLTSTANETEITNAAGSITIGLPAAVTIGTLTLTTDLDVTHGGTGAGTFTDGGVLLGAGTGAITATNVLTNGQLLIGDGTTAPALATLTGTANEITVTNAAGTITLDIPDAVTLNTLTLTNDLTVENGGTGIGTLTSHGVLVGAGTSAFTATTVGTNGQMLLGQSAADPTWQTMDGDGTLGATGTLAIANDSIARANLIEDSLAIYGIPLPLIANADGSVLSITANATDFGISCGGWGSGTLTLDGKAASGVVYTNTCMFEFILPPEYVADEDVKLVVTAKESVGAATVATTLSGEVYESDGEGAVGGNIYNAFDNADITISWQTCTAVITDSALVAGDRLVVFIRIITDDQTGGIGTVAQIGKIELQLDIKG